MERVIRVGVIGVDHGHILGMAASMRAAGAQIVAWSTGVETGDAERAAFRSLFPDVPQREEAAVLEDGSLDIILSAAVNADRARIAIAAMRHGKDVMVDKPGCTSLEQLAQIRAVQAETGRIWSVCFSERLQVESATLAGQLITEGRIGKVVQTVGLGPHRLNAPTRPDWFWARERSGASLRTSARISSTSSCSSPALPAQGWLVPMRAMWPMPSGPAFRTSAKCCWKGTAGAAMRGWTG